MTLFRTTCVLFCFVGCTSGQPTGNLATPERGGGGTKGEAGAAGGGSAGTSGAGGVPRPPAAQPSCDECAGVRFVDVGLGDDHACALSDDGRVFCWGSGHLGQIGVSDTPEVCKERVTSICGWESGPPPETFDFEWPCPTHPVEVKLPSAATALTVGPNHVCSLVEDGSALCWGGGFGSSKCELGVPPMTGGINCESGGPEFPENAPCARTPVVTGGGGVSRVLAYGATAPWTWGVCYWLGLSIIECDGWTPAAFTPDAHDPTVEALREFDTHGERLVCALYEDGEVRCASPAGAGPAAAAVISGIAPATDIAVGSFFACAVEETGTVSCWGDNQLGQLGVPCRGAECGVAPHRVPGLSDIVEVESARDFACARDLAGTVTCWGRDRFAWPELPECDGACAPSTVPLSGSAVSIAARGGLACAALESGAVECWGSYSGPGGYSRDNHLEPSEWWRAAPGAAVAAICSCE